jgi:hypothetical protein
VVLDEATQAPEPAALVAVAARVSTYWLTLLQQRTCAAPATAVAPAAAAAAALLIINGVPVTVAK